MNLKNTLVTVLSRTLVITAVALSGERNEVPSPPTEIVVESPTTGNLLGIPKEEKCIDRELANAALDSQDFVLVEHYIERLVRHGADLTATVDLIVRLSVMKSDNTISSRDWEDIRIYRKNCVDALQINEEGINTIRMFLQMEINTSASRQAEVDLLRKAIIQLEKNKASLSARRKAWFDTYANVKLREARETFTRGKGTWYQNDEENLFQDALYSIQWCWAVDSELSAESRSQLVDLQTQIKNELSDADYNGTLARFQLVAGTVH